MVYRWEELSEVEGYHTSFEIYPPSGADNMGEETTSIFGRVLTNASKLVGVEDTMLSSFELHPGGEHLLREFAQCVQENNWVRILESVVRWFAWLGYNHHGRGFEFCRLVA